MKPLYIFVFPSWKWDTPLLFRADTRQQAEKLYEEKFGHPPKRLLYREANV